MAETTADVRRDIEMTRERMSDTIAQLERKLNLLEVVREHPWPSIALAAGAGFALAGSNADVKAAAATVKATGGASNRLGELLDTAAASAVTLLAGALEQRIDGFVSELKSAIGAPADASSVHLRDGAVSGNGPVAPRTGEVSGRTRELEQPM